MRARYQRIEMRVKYRYRHHVPLDKLWCRECGQPLITAGLQAGLLDQPKFAIEDLRWNVLMLCAHCAVPNRDARPNAGKVEDRLLYQLLISGIARVGWNQSNEPWYDPPVLIHEMTRGHAETARNYLGGAVRGVKGVWIGSHIRLPVSTEKKRRKADRPQGYVVGHLKTVSTPCNCTML